MIMARLGQTRIDNATRKSIGDQLGLKVTAPAKPGNKPGRMQRAQELAASASNP